MTDRHMRILRHMARQAQRKLDHHDTFEPAGDAASTGRRDYLKRAATRMRGQVAAAEQRRRAAEQRAQASPPARKARP
jgi:hypothetical protein